MSRTRLVALSTASTLLAGTLWLRLATPRDARPTSTAVDTATYQLDH